MKTKKIKIFVDRSENTINAFLEKIPEEDILDVKFHVTQEQEHPTQEHVLVIYRSENETN